MKAQGEGFKFFVDGESKTGEETKSLIHDGMTVSIKGLDVHYFSAKKENRVEKILKQVEYYQNENAGLLEGIEFPFDYMPTDKVGDLNYDNPHDIWNNKDAKKATEDQKHSKGIKKTQGKLHYELSWEFIEEMAKRMANNKSDKYTLYNWKKSINIQDLKDAINRHHIEVMKGNYQDEDEVLGHIVSYSCNAMMLWEQLRRK